MKKIFILMAFAAFGVACTDGDGKASSPDFSVTASSATVFVDETVDFSFEGGADIISFWSGEPGNDYAWSGKERIAEGEGYLHFATAFSNGAQWQNQALDDISKKPLTFLWSDDFSGVYTLDSLKKATWHDATGLFTFPSARVSDSRVAADATESGRVAVSDIIPAGTRTPLYFAFRYHVLPIRVASTDSRSRAAVHAFTIDCINEAAHVNEAVVTNSTAGWTIVNSGYNDDDAQYMPQVAASYIYFNCSTTNEGERYSWAVSRPYTPDYSVNMGCDYAVGIKAYADAPMKGYTHSYSAPGDYTAVFRSTNVARDGSSASTLHEIKIKVVQGGSASIDQPEQKEWQ